MAIRPSIVAGPADKDKAKIKTATDSEFGSSSWTGIHGKPALDPSYIENQREKVDAPANPPLKTDKQDTTVSDTSTETSISTDIDTSAGTDTSTDTNGSGVTFDSYEDFMAAVNEIIATNNNKASENFPEYYDELMNYVKGLNLGNQAGEAHDIYKSNSEAFMTGVNDIVSWLKDNADKVLAEAQGNPLDTEWGKGILDYYGLLGEQSANAVNAATAGENAGNIDSYAAANAERQRLSKLGQGISAVSGMSTDRVNNMLSVLNSIGVNTNELFGTMGEYGVDTAASYADSLHATDADFLSSLFGTSADLEATKYASDADLTKSTNELKAAIETGTTPVINLSDNAVAAQLMSAYKDLDVQGGGDGEIDWTATDTETWNAVKKALKTNPAFENLNDTYLNALIAKIIKNKGGWDWAKDILKIDAGA